MSVDLILKAPVEELLVGRFRPNRKYKLIGPGALELGDVERPYGKLDKYLVRTALVRAEGYDRGKAPKLDTTRSVAKICRHLTAMDQEYLVTFAVDNALRLLAIHETGIGGKAGAGATAADLIKVALLCSARGLFVVHNHPSGSPLPSKEDLALRSALEHAAACVGLEFLDSMIMAADGFYSIVMDQVETWDVIGKPESRGTITVD